MTHNHSPNTVVGRHGLTLKFNKFCVFADKCKVPRGKRKSSFRFSSIQTRQQVLHRNTCMQVLLALEHMRTASGYLCRSMKRYGTTAKREEPRAALVRETSE